MYKHCTLRSKIRWSPFFINTSLDYYLQKNNYEIYLIIIVKNLSCVMQNISYNEFSSHCKLLTYRIISAIFDLLTLDIDRK